MAMKLLAPLGLLLLLSSSLTGLVLAQTRLMCLSQIALASQACAVLPVGGANYTEAHHNNHRHSHRHRHRHEHKHEQEPKRQEQSRAHIDCCHWLSELDEECVCDTLLGLPKFLTKPRHTYTVSVASACRITFKCGGV